MNIDRSLNLALKAVPKAVAAGIIDMDSGMLLGIKTSSSHPSEVFDFLAAATKDIYEGDNVTAIEDIFRESRGEKNNGERYFKEIVIFSSNLLHYFKRIPDNPSTVFSVVCSIDANIGLVLVKSRGIVKNIQV